ncbi:glycosyltransferase, MSMEG_0565 family [Arboricoccus pini]|uniref:Glycosyltransferase, MSMEG_0565 family n=1 Tax=Arboricoccus pini TaxID=1963835 RepID=A0A212RKK0_9PROT|nr:MSMEG_0565 family glycosyltransferase [Arboricoccus pini]SNB73004.1 glycosyltransferase, MSMEG_0565 family [Arboricoccus pini]
MRLRVALFTHSVNPRGGVAHALALGEALLARGVEAVVIGPDQDGRGFFRQAACETVALPVAAVGKDLRQLVSQRIDEISAYVANQPPDRFHILHAQDPISANAVLALRPARIKTPLVRTVHHVDNFADPVLACWSQRAIEKPDVLCCVSAHWQAILRKTHGREAFCVGNGVALDRFSPAPRPQDAALRQELELGQGPLFLAVGGIEARKNSQNILAAFRWVQAALPEARLIFAGGATLLDHSSYQAAFAAKLAAYDPDLIRAVQVTGALPQPRMESLYRLADALVFPSFEEGFGLAVIEAMASGTPVIVADRPPFRDYLGAHECLWVDPSDPAAIAAAMRASLDPKIGPDLARRGPKVAARFDWQDVADRHVPLYARLAASTERSARCRR